MPTTPRDLSETASRRAFLVMQFVASRQRREQNLAGRPRLRMAIAPPQRAHDVARTVAGRLRRGGM